MAAFRRIIALFWGLVLLAGAAGIAVCLVNHRLALLVADFIERCLLYNFRLAFVEGVSLWWPIAIGVVLLLLGLLLIVAAFKKRRQPKQVCVTSKDGGTVFIALQAVDNVVRKAASGVAGVRNVNSKLDMARDGLHIYLDITMPPDASVPATGAEVRQQVSRQLDSMVGITAQEIKVSISNLSDGKSAARPGAYSAPISITPEPEAAEENSAAPTPVVEEIILPPLDAEEETESGRE